LINREIVCGIASEENDEFITVEGSDNSHNNKYGINRSTRWVIKYRRERFCGNYFSVYTRITPLGTPVTMDDFLQPGTSQVAAGYVIYGTSTMIVYTTGCVNGFT
jgi:fructose-1,6-bisphosphatase I